MDMPKHTERSAVIDGILKLVAAGGITATLLIAPNAIQLFDKPIKKYFKDLDEREQRRELQRMLAYMKYNKLISENYDHGLRLTAKAKKRLKKRNYDEITIQKPEDWDNKWRIVFFDIPEAHKSSRDGFAAKLRLLGFKVLQRSVFIHPFPCLDEVMQVASHYRVERFVSYIETSFLDNEAVLITRFKSLLK